MRVLLLFHVDSIVQFLQLSVTLLQLALQKSLTSLLLAQPCFSLLQLSLYPFNGFPVLGDRGGGRGGDAAGRVQGLPHAVTHKEDDLVHFPQLAKPCGFLLTHPHLLQQRPEPHSQLEKQLLRPETQRILVEQPQLGLLNHLHRLELGVFDVTDRSCAAELHNYRLVRMR